ncbi:hypothetical protein NIES37_38600 [Tolypothrix tenuis PCC 7101]|uniref:Uncharacterized protein n=1 Tax=Tolypothrix tenuis PCC 7101 TaxID=231146 RepID=A0A1Z4N2D0_9CYAN|nr:hypothetical protein [Aulosira sp. FACHB-113]BAY99877.1 hypothetical protein NIES37_38600 [Tolypothrix tenuis PCC 7101]BAZ76201.1 hypothetical protein NIES50_47990 [Aulosira laxa NIES-50]
MPVYRTEAGGDSVDLGGFGQYVHKRDRRSQVEWSVDIGPKQLSTLDQGLVDLLQPIKKLTVGVGIGTRLGKGKVIGRKIQGANSGNCRVRDGKYLS